MLPMQMCAGAEAERPDVGTVGRSGRVRWWVVAKASGSSPPPCPGQLNARRHRATSRTTLIPLAADLPATALPGRSAGIQVWQPGWPVRSDGA